MTFSESLNVDPNAILHKKKAIEISECSFKCNFQPIVTLLFNLTDSISLQRLY